MSGGISRTRSACSRQRRPTRDDQDQIRTGGDQVGHELRRVWEQLLEVVESEEKPALGDRLDQITVGLAELSRDRGEEEPRVE